MSGRRPSLLEKHGASLRSRPPFSSHHGRRHNSLRAQIISQSQLNGQSSKQGLTAVGTHENTVSAPQRSVWRQTRVQKQLRQFTREAKSLRHSPQASTSQTAGSSSEQYLDNSEHKEADTAFRWFYAFFKFTRPHTMLGTLVSIMSVSLLALGPHDIGWRSLFGLLQALIPALFMNIHIVGLNQIFDVKIDKVNKPYLPLASGEFSMQTASLIVALCGITALIIGALVGSTPLMLTLIGSAVLGLAYSVDLPFLRWKRSPVLAACCILAVRAVLVQLGFYFHMRQYMGDSQLIFTRPLLFTVSFMLFFSIVIALFKDIPDVKGDSQAGLRTLSVRAGTKKVFWLCISLLEIAYLGAISTGIASTILWSRIATVISHACLGGLLFRKALQTDLKDSKQIYGCYMYVWKLFYAEYLLIPLLR